MTVTFTSQVTRGVVGAALPLAYQATPKLFRSVTVAELTVADLQPGDLVHATGAGQVATRDGITRAMHCRYLKVTKTGNNAHDEGLILARPMGVNFTDLQHYSLLDADGSFVVTTPWAGSVKLMLVMYAAGLSGVATDPRSLQVKYVDLRADVSRIR